MATSKTIQYYEAGIHLEHLDDIDEDDNRREAWFKLCSYVAEAMKTLKHFIGSNFLFYWVDGIYFKSFDKLYNTDGTVFDYKTKGYDSPVQVLIEILKKKFYFECKVIELNKFALTNYGLDEFGQPDLRIIIEKMENGKFKKKLFTPPGEKVIGYELTDESEFN